ncbi:Proteinral transcription factor iie tfiie subunit [Fasciola hepatica]|uniref:General transcription and DNA repair factor IIH subunit TFB5 n=1 Tax=Fasciola hepatica TaxID=6192 RepID=A0A2H1CIR6_FASHE|nr:Proteinral transcription factor iie tfiie subunit [Fasciola hepatica]
MVNVHKGVLVRCDPAMKQFLLHLAENLVLGKNFVHTDLDDHHLFIDPDILGRLQERVDQLMESLSFPMTVDGD